jgi:restriction endonuclease S subunit
MSSDFSKTRLENVLNFANGRTSPERDDAAGVPVFGSNGLIGKASESNSQPNTIVIGRVGSYCGSVHFSKDACWVTDNAIRAIAKGDNDPSFLYYLLRHLNLNNWRSGSGQPLINQTTLNAIEAPTPTPSEQRAISSFVGALDDRIALLRETNATLEAIAQALFKSWFVDFDPVRAKMAGLAPEGMDEATAALFPDALEETEFGVVPKGWGLRPFIEAVDVIGGGTPKTSNPDYWGGEIPWFSVVDAPDGADTFVVDTEKHITEAGLKGSSTKLLPQGTTIISARGTVGKLALTGCPMTMNQSCYGLRGKAGDSYFTYFSTCRLVEALKARSHGSVFDTITRDTLASVHSLVPADSCVIDAFEHAVKPLMNRILWNLKQSRCLADMRDTLLPRLISGQLRLPEAQAQLEHHLS